MEEEGVVPGLDGLSSCKDQLSWAQCWLEASYFESCLGSPKGCLSPGKLAEAFPDLCPSPQLSDQLKLLHSWSSGTPKHDEVLQAEEALTTSSVSCSESEASHTLVTSDLTMESGRKFVKESRKRKSTRLHDDSLAELLEKDSMQKVKVKKPKRSKGPRFAIKTRSDVDIMEDGYKWRKYGQKPVKSSPHPRNYYRCTTANCPVRKRVERCTEDTGLVITSYEGTHTHPRVIQQKNSTSSSGVSTSHDLKSLLDQALYQPGALPPTVPNLSHLWGSLMNFPGWPAAPSSSHDNTSLIMAYQLVKLQWELQARTKQFLDFSSQTSAPAFPDHPEMMNVDVVEPEQDHFPRKSMGSSLLRKRARAFQHGAPLPLDLQSIAMMQHLQ